MLLMIHVRSEMERTCERNEANETDELSSLEGEFVIIYIFNLCFINYPIVFRLGIGIVDHVKYTFIYISSNLTTHTI